MKKRKKATRILRKIKKNGNFKNKCSSLVTNGINMITSRRVSWIKDLPDKKVVQNCLPKKGFSKKKIDNVTSKEKKGY